MILKRYRLKLPIRIISFVLLISFAAQNIVWADPDIISTYRNSDKLAPETFIRHPEAPEQVDAKFVQLKIEGGSHIPKASITIKGISAILDRLAGRLDKSGIRYNISKDCDEALITFPAGCALRYFSPATKTRGIAGFREIEYEALGNIDRQVLRPLTDKTGPANVAKKSTSPYGAAIDAQKVRNVAFIGVLTAPLLCIMAPEIHSVFATAVVFTYVFFMAFIPLKVASHIAKAVSFRHKHKDHGLISPFAKAENLRILETILDLTNENDRKILSDIKGKISYFSYNLENEIKSGKRPGIKSGLLADKEALRRMPKWAQWYVYIHEGIEHGGTFFGGRLRIKTELPTLILNFSLPLIVVNLTAAAILTPFLPPSSISFLLFIAMYDIALPIVFYVFAKIFGTYKSVAGHYHLNVKGWEHLTDKEIDELIVRFAHKKDKNGMMKNWLDWLRGGVGEENVEMIKSGNRPDDILVVKGEYKPGEPGNAALLTEKIESSDKHSLVLIIADDDSKELPVKDRKARVVAIEKEVQEALKAARSKKAFGIIPISKFIKKDIRSTTCDLTRLKELLKLYRRRADQIKHENIEREVVAPEVHGNIDRLNVALKWPGKNGYRREVFMGDIIGARPGQPGLEALDILMDHMESGDLPRLELLMGQTEHYFLLAMFGTKSWTEQWPVAGLLGGPNVMKSLKDLTAKDPSTVPPSRLKRDIEEARQFEERLAKIARRHHKNIDKYMEHLRVKYYRFHPKIMQAARFMIDKMHFVYYEDPHYNVYITKSIRENVEWRGLKGLEAIRAMEEEYKEQARLSMWLVAVMRDIWIATEEASEAKPYDSNKYRDDILSIVRKSAPAMDDMYMSEKRGQLGIIEDVINNADPKALPYVMFAEIDDKMKKATRPLPEIFNILCYNSSAEGDFWSISPFISEAHGGVEVSLDTDRERQVRRLAVGGVNTVINLQSFTSGIQDCGQLRILTKKGELLLASVDALKEGRVEAETVLFATTEDELRMSGKGVRHFVKNQARFTEEEINGRRGYIDLESHTVHREDGRILAKAMISESFDRKWPELEGIEELGNISGFTKCETAIKFEDNLVDKDRDFARDLFLSSGIRDGTVVYSTVSGPRIVKNSIGVMSGFVDLSSGTVYDSSRKKLAVAKTAVSSSILSIKNTSGKSKTLNTSRSNTKIVFEEGLGTDAKVFAVNLLRASDIKEETVHVYSNGEKYIEDTVSGRTGFLDLKTGTVYREDGTVIAETITGRGMKSSVRIIYHDMSVETFPALKQESTHAFRLTPGIDDRDKVLALGLLRDAGLLRGVKSLESVTREKIVSVEDAVGDYDNLAAVLQPKWHSHYTNILWHFAANLMRAKAPDLKPEPPDISAAAALRSSLAENSTSSAGKDGPPRDGSADGSPRYMVKLLKRDFRNPFTSIDELRKYTKGRADDGHLAIETVGRDINTLNDLGLIDVKTKGKKAQDMVFRAADLSPPEWEAIEPVLKRLGARPTHAQKEKAKSDILKARVGAVTKVLRGYRDILSDEGIALLRKFEACGKNFDSTNAGELLKQSPTLGNINPDLFIDITIPGNVISYNDIFMIQFNEGCYNRCAFCQTNSKKHYKFMPYPLAVKLMNAIKVQGGMCQIFPYNENDPLHYRDRVIGADFADIYMRLMNVSSSITLLTNGWDVRDKVAQRSAEKLAVLLKERVQHGKDIPDDNRLTISYHFFYDDLIEAIRRGDKKAEARIYEGLKRKYINMISTFRARSSRPVINIINRHMQKTEMDLSGFPQALKRCQVLQRRAMAEIREELGIRPAEMNVHDVKFIQWNYGRARERLEGLGFNPERLPVPTHTISTRNSGVGGISYVFRPDGKIEVEAEMPFKIGSYISEPMNEDFLWLVIGLRSWQRLGIDKLADSSDISMSDGMEEFIRNLMSRRYPELFQALEKFDLVRFKKQDLVRIYEMIKDIKLPYVRLSVRRGYALDIKNSREGNDEFWSVSIVERSGSDNGRIFFPSLNPPLDRFKDATEILDDFTVRFYKPNIPEILTAEHISLPVVSRRDPSPEALKVCGVQIKQGDFLDNTRKMIEIAGGMGRWGMWKPDMVLFPEFMDDVYSMNIDPEERVVSLQKVSDMTGIAIGYFVGSLRENDSIAPYNKAYTILRPGKPPLIFKKFKNENEERLIEINGRTVSLLICYENLLPAVGAADPRTDRALRGSDVILMPSGSDDINSAGRQYKLARLYGKPVVFVNYGGGRGMNRPTSSFVFGGEDSVRSRVDLGDEDAILYADVDGYHPADYTEPDAAARERWLNDEEAAASPAAAPNAPVDAEYARFDSIGVFTREFGDRNKDVLKFLGISPDAVITGYESIPVYHSWVPDSDDEYETQRVTHRHTLNIEGRPAVVFYTKRHNLAKGSNVSENEAAKFDNEVSLACLASDHGLAPKELELMDVHNLPTIFSLAMEGSPVSENSVTPDIIEAIGFALARLHGIGIAHGDIYGYILKRFRAEHVFVNFDGNGKPAVSFIDYGSSEYYNDIESNAAIAGIVGEHDQVLRGLVEFAWRIPADEVKARFDAGYGKGAPPAANAKPGEEREKRPEAPADMPRIARLVKIGDDNRIYLGTAMAARLPRHIYLGYESTRDLLVSVPESRILWLYNESKSISPFNREGQNLLAKLSSRLGETDIDKGLRIILPKALMRYLKVTQGDTLALTVTEGGCLEISKATTETQMAKEFRKFAAICREKMRMIRQHAEEKRYEEVISSVDAVIEASKEFSDPEFRELMVDTLNNLYAIKIFVAGGSVNKDQVDKTLGDMENALVELEKIAAAGRLPEAEKAKISSGLFDADLILNPAGKSMPGTDGVSAFLAEVHAAAFEVNAKHKFATGSQVILSASLFSPEDAAQLQKVLRGKFGEDSPVKIVEAERIQDFANRSSGRDKVGCVMSKADYDNKALWKRIDEKATVLVLGEDLMEDRYLHIEGVVALVRAMMAGEAARDAAGRLVGLLFGKVDGNDVAALVKLLLKDPRAFAEIVKFRPVNPADVKGLDQRYRLDVENYLIMA